MIQPDSSTFVFDFIPVKTLCHGTHRIKDVPLNASNDTVFQLVAEEISACKSQLRVLCKNEQFEEYEPEKHRDLMKIYTKHDWSENNPFMLHVKFRMGAPTRRSVDPYSHIECSICLEKKLHYKFICFKSCMHMLCLDCIGRISTCPFCRSNILSIQYLNTIPDRVKVYHS